MYLRILKKDLKRKKTMNMILLLFVILSSMFAASSVNNIFTVVNGLDHYFEKAGMADYYYVSRDSGGRNEAEELLKKSESINSYKLEHTLYISANNLTADGRKFIDTSNVILGVAESDWKLKYFDRDNEEIRNIEPGKVYLTSTKPRKSGIKVGDRFTLTVEGVSKELEVAGFAKDAFLGSDMMSNIRLLMNDEDFAAFANDPEVKQYDMGRIMYVYTDDIPALEREIADVSNLMFDGSNDMIKTSYIMNMLVAMIILVISIGLIIVSFVVLRFTIGFTITEEFREIGVMKAVGIRNSSIRVLYLVKYFGISLIGAAIGFFASIPFGKLLLQSVSESMVLGSDNAVLIGILCCAAVVGLIMLFCWGCTRRIKKLSPIDAVRSGQTGERFRKRSLLSLGRSRMGSTGFMAANDVLSAPKQYGLVAVVFMICSVMIMILSITSNTLNSDKIVYLLAVQESDVYLNEPSMIMDILSGKRSSTEAKQYISGKLAENGMPGETRVELWYKLPVTVDGERYNCTFLQCKDSSAEDYVYTEGSAPEDGSEIALTKILADKIGVGLGDKVKIDTGHGPQEFIVTAFFQCFNNLGECGRMHQDVELDDSLVNSAFSFQISFDDRPDRKTLDERIDKIKDIFDTDNVFDSSGFVNDTTGVSETLASVKDLALIISLIIIILIAVLMERSFISKEKAEIALMKAIGFKSRSVIALHTLRFILAVAAAEAAAAAVCIPLTKLTMSPCFAIMGATGHIEYRIDPLEQFVLYPLIILAATALSVMLTALCTRKIHASDTADIE